MTQKEARRLALLVIASEVSALLDTSDEFCRHPETDAELSRDDYVKVTSQSRRFVKKLYAQAEGLAAQVSRKDSGGT